MCVDLAFLGGLDDAAQAVGGGGGEHVGTADSRGLEEAFGPDSRGFFLGGIPATGSGVGLSGAALRSGLLLVRRRPPAAPLQSLAGKTHATVRTTFPASLLTPYRIGCTLSCNDTRIRIHAGI